MRAARAAPASHHRALVLLTVDERGTTVRRTEKGVEVGEIAQAALETDLGDGAIGDAKLPCGVLHADAIDVVGRGLTQHRPHGSGHMLRASAGGFDQARRTQGEKFRALDLLTGALQPVGHGREQRIDGWTEQEGKSEQKVIEGQAGHGGGGERRELPSQSGDEREGQSEGLRMDLAAMEQGGECCCVAVEQVVTHPGGEGQVDEREPRRRGRLQPVAILGLDEEQITRLKHLLSTIDLVAALAPLDPEDLGEIVGVEPRGAIGKKQDDREVVEFGRADERMPSLVFDHINIAP